MTQDCLAVCVAKVSKIYRLWNSPKERLIYPLKQLLSSLIPSKLWKVNTQPLECYREFHALNDISFEIFKGESYGFVGVNGSGKSTLLKIISGNLRPTSGSVEINGKVVILDYSSSFNGDFTGRENIYIKAALLGLTRKQIKERYDSIVEFADLGNFIDQPIKFYSSGMVSRLGFAIIAHVDADIIIADEALAVGDVFFVQKCMDFIHNFLKKGTFLFVSHSASDIMSYCEKAVWLEKGTVKAIGPASVVTQAYLNNTQNNEALLKKRNQEQSQLIVDKKETPIVVLGESSLPIRRPVNNNQLNYLSNLIESRITAIPLFETDGSHDIGGATILEVILFDENGVSLSRVIGGELVTLTIKARARHMLSSPIIGFQFLDRLGQILLADNSFLSSQSQSFTVEGDTIFSTKFIFQMPLLPAGEYVIRAFAAIITTEGKSQILHTANNALVFHSVTTGSRHGLVGIPMLSIKLKCNVLVQKVDIAEVS